MADLSKYKKPAMNILEVAKKDNKIMSLPEKNKSNKKVIKKVSLVLSEEEYNIIYSKHKETDAPITKILLKKLRETDIFTSGDKK